MCAHSGPCSCTCVCVCLCVCVCVCVRWQRKWEIEVRGSADLLWENPVRLLMSSNHHLTLIPTPHCLVQIDLYDPVCVCLCVSVCVCVCVHLQPPHQSTKVPLLIALHSVHLSTCLLVLVISLDPNKLKLIVTTLGEVFWVGKSGEMWWKERRWGDEEIRTWGNEEMREGGVKSHDGFCSASWGLQQHPHPLVQWKVFLVHTSAFQNEISSTGKKTDAYSYKMIVFCM